jgi:hypothetical protein
MVWNRGINPTKLLCILFLENVNVAYTEQWRVFILSTALYMQH